MVRRFRRIGRRRPRRLRRFRRARRSYGRRRFRRFRRYRRRRGYGRRRRFYSRKGAKTAIAYLTPAGRKNRTYRFYLTKKILQDFDGGWRSGQDLVRSTYSFSILYGKTYSWGEHTNLNNTVHTWTGPGCMYSVTNVPVSFQRVLGYDKYTVINLGWFDLFYLQAIGYFPNQRRLIQYDLDNYSFYKPISVTCKLVPRYARPPSKFGYPHSASMKIYQPPGQGTDPFDHSSGNWTLSARMNEDIPPAPVEPLDSTLTVNSAATAWDEDSTNLVAYLIPLTGQGLPQNLHTDPRLTVANSIFSSVLRTPTEDFMSSFRKAGYSRVTLSTGRPTRFVYKFTRNNLSERLHIPDDAFWNIQGLGLGMNPTQFWEKIRWGNANAGYSMVNRDDDIVDSLRKNWIEATKRSVYVFRSGNVNAQGGIEHAGDRIETVSMDSIPIDACAVFIPGIDTQTLFTKYNVQFSFNCIFAGRTYDIT